MSDSSSHPDSSSRSAAAMRIDDSVRPWYLDATPLATLPWLIRIRWLSAAIDLAVLLAAALFPASEFPLHQVWPLVLAAGIGNVVVALWLPRNRPLPHWLAAVGIALEVLLLTGLLELTGGPFNPFAVIMAALVAVAALTLGASYAAGIGVFAAGCYCVLVYWHTREFVPGHHRLTDVPTHLLTMWIAVAVCAELAAYFVAQASSALKKREAELEAMRLQAARTERVVSLTTLAAGAAHELSTPLATIALAARELERSAAAVEVGPGLQEDARLIRTEVDRCQAILDQMSGRAGGMAEDRPEPVDLSAVLADVQRHLPAAQADRLRLSCPPIADPVLLPLAGLRQTLANLIKNAIDAGEGEVFVEVAQDRERLRFSVRDQGSGMSPGVLGRAGEPFFTTKDPGRGLGLGLFLARVFAERCGGSLTLQSDSGTTVSLDLPMRTSFPGVV